MKAPWFPDPVMLKELRAGARNWTLYAGRVFYVGLVGLILYASWASFARYQVRESLSEYATIGRQLFFTFAVFQLLFATLQGISGASDLISRETRVGTLGLLGLTPLSPFRIAFGKFLAAMAQPLQVILAGTPVLAICIYLGGVPPSSLAWCTGLSLACGAMGAGTALLCSACFKTGAGAAITSVILLVLYTLAPFLLLAVFFQSSASRDVFVLIAFLHPVWALVLAMSGGFGTGWDAHAWKIAVPVTFAQALLLVWFTGRRLGVLLRSQNFAARLESVLFPNMPRTISRVADVPDRSVWERWPLLWKELQTPSNRFKYRSLIAFGLFIGILTPLTLMFSNGTAFAGMLLWLGGILLLFLAVGTGAGLFVKEKEERKWEILLTTPLSATQILAGKLIGGLADLLPLAGMLLLVLTAMTLLMGAELWAWMLIVLAVAFPVTLIYVLSALISLRASSSRKAFSTAFGGMLFFYFLLPSVLGLLVAILSRSSSSGDFINLISPASYLADFHSWTGYANGSSLGERLLPQLVEFLVFLTVHGVLILACLELMRSGFKKAARRV